MWWFIKKIEENDTEITLMVMNPKTLPDRFLLRKTYHLSIFLNMQKMTMKILLQNYSDNRYFPLSEVLVLLKAIK